MRKIICIKTQSYIPDLFNSYLQTIFVYTGIIMQTATLMNKQEVDKPTIDKTCVTTIAYAYNLAVL